MPRRKVPTELKLDANACLLPENRLIVEKNWSKGEESDIAKMQVIFFFFLIKTNFSAPLRSKFA